ncbi:hypothetical protein [Stenotrophomonas lactitubi]|uniref:hypothetical protein n=1 Tax=Stenotrophomonas lactitubi TaxID=2045214 RepID=UPI001E4B8B56|nr:hypothetical protein [Stenotrophomonas lactitubi]
MAEVNLSDLEFSGRLDAEYYRPEHLRKEAILTERGGTPLSLLCDFLIGPFGSAFTVENYCDDPTYRYIRGKDVKAMAIEENDNVYMPKSDFERLSKYALKAGDVLVSVVGTLGNSALVEPHHVPAIFSCKSTALRTTSIDARYLIAYLNCKYGRDLLIRKERGAIQKGLNLDDLKSLQIFISSPKLQSAIANVHQLAGLEKHASKSALLRADSQLAKAMDLASWQALEPLSYVRRSSEAFTAERLDAEYFHPQKASALATLRAASDIAVGDLFSSVRKLWQPGEGLPADLVRNYDLNDALVPFLDGEKSPVARAEIASTKKLLQAGDLVVSRLRSYLREIAIVEASADYPMVASTEYIVLRPRGKIILPVEALLVYLRSRLPQILLKWSQDGSNHPRFDEKEILRMPIPRVLIDNPAPYVEAMQAMKSAKQRAAKLLNAAKRAVEIAIEDSEAAALAYLHQAAPPEH